MMPKAITWALLIPLNLLCLLNHSEKINDAEKKTKMRYLHLINKGHSMKKTFITLLITSVLLGAACRAESTLPVMTITIGEYDCSGRPDLFEEYKEAAASDAIFKIDTQGGIDNEEEALLRKITKNSTNTLSFTNGERVPVGEAIAQVTKIQNYGFTLEALVEDVGDESFRITVTYMLSSNRRIVHHIDNAQATIKRGHQQAINFDSVSTRTVLDENGAEKVINTVVTSRLTIN